MPDFSFILSINKNSTRHSKKETGIYLTLLAVFLVALAILCALVMGLGYVFTDLTALQNITNLSSLAAIEEFVTTDRVIPDSSAPGGFRQITFYERAQKAITRANQVLSENSLLGTSTALGSLSLYPSSSPGSGGELILGNFYREKPPGAEPVTCITKGYPCFVPVPDLSNTSSANAVRIQGKGQNILAPLASFVGQDLFQIETAALGTIVPRCTAFVLDLSASTTQETHPQNPGTLIGPTDNPPPPPYISNPTFASLFAYTASKVIGLNCAQPPDSTYTLPLVHAEQAYWCNMNYYCGNPDPDHTRSNADEDLATLNGWDHYVTTRPDVPGMEKGWWGGPKARCRFPDYKLVTVPTGSGDVNFWIDRLRNSDPSVNYTGAQPFNSFLGAANAIFRLLESQANLDDQGILLGFDGSVRSSYPSINPGPAKLSRDIGMLAQLTNPDAVETYDIDTSRAAGAPPIVGQAVYPNYTTLLLFPIRSDTAGSNLSEAVQTATSILSSECLPEARKSIILATDAISTCSQATGCATFSFDPNYLTAESELAGLVPELISRKIALTVIADGDYVGLNYKNVCKDSTCTEFLTFEEAQAKGYRGDPSAPAANIFFDASPVIPADLVGDYDTWKTTNCGSLSEVLCQNKYAFRYAGEKTGVKFPRGAATIFDLAFQTGGLACPMLPLCTTGPGCTEAVQPGCLNNCYEDKDNNSDTPCTLKNSNRVPGTFQTCSPQAVSKLEFAERCAKDAVAKNPFVLAEEDDITHFTASSSPTSSSAAPSSSATSSASAPPPPPSSAASSSSVASSSAPPVSSAAGTSASSSSIMEPVEG